MVECPYLWGTPTRGRFESTRSNRRGKGVLKMIKSSYGCVRYARRVPNNNYTLLDLVVDFNDELKSSKNTIEG